MPGWVDDPVRGQAGRPEMACREGQEWVFPLGGNRLTKERGRGGA